MFNKLKQFRDIKSFQHILESQRIEVVRENIKVTVDGTQRIVSLSIPPDCTVARLESLLPELINDAMKKIQRQLADKMRAGEITMPTLPQL